VYYTLLGTDGNALDVAPVFVSLVRPNASSPDETSYHLNMLAQLEENVIARAFPLPCSTNACSFMTYRPSEGVPYELQLTYAHATQYERVITLSLVVVNTSLDMEFEPASETPTGIAGLPIVLGTMSIRPLEPLNTTYFAFVGMYIISPEGTTASLELEYFFKFISVDGSNNTDEFTYPVGTRMNDPTHTLYQIGMSQHASEDSPTVTFEMTDEVDHAVFMDGASPKYMQTVDVGQRIPLRVKIMSSLGVPVPHRRVIVVLMLCGEDTANDPRWGPMTRCAEYSNLFADESILVNPNVSFNVSEYISLSTFDAEESVDPEIPDGFGIAQFDDYAVSSARNGTYVLVAFVSSLAKGTSLPFQIRNLVYSIHLSGFPESMESQSTKDFSDDPIIVSVTDPQGNPLQGKPVFFRMELKECHDFSNLCIVQPVLIIEGGSTRTGSDGKLHIKKLRLSGGSIGDYSVWAVVSGIASSELVFKVKSKDSIQTSDLDLFKYMAIFLFVILIPEMLGNSHGTRTYWIFIGLAASGGTCVASIVLNFSPVFTPNNDLLRTSYLGLLLVYLSVLLWILIFLAFAVLAVFALMRKEKSILFSSTREEESKEYVHELLYGMKDRDDNDAEELEDFGNQNQQLRRRLLDEAVTTEEDKEVVVEDDDSTPMQGINYDILCSLLTFLSHIFDPPLPPSISDHIIVFPPQEMKLWNPAQKGQTRHLVKGCCTSRRKCTSLSGFPCCLYWLLYLCSLLFFFG
jgi:hypothetical protein